MMNCDVRPTNTFPVDNKPRTGSDDAKTLEDILFGDDFEHYGPDSEYEPVS